MRALIAKLMILVAIANAVSLEDAFANDASATFKVIEVSASQEETGGETHNESDCDTETCARHQCHLGHCQFHSSVHSIDLSRQQFARLLATPHFVGALPSDFRSGLIKPPCV